MEFPLDTLWINLPPATGPSKNNKEAPATRSNLVKKIDIAFMEFELLTVGWMVHWQSCAVYMASVEVLPSAITIDAAVNKAGFLVKPQW